MRTMYKSDMIVPVNRIAIFLLSMCRLLDGWMTCNITSFLRYFSHTETVRGANERLCAMDYVNG